MAGTQAESRGRSPLAAAQELAEKYAPVIDVFYSGGKAVELETTITYEDGRQAVMKSRVRVEDVDAPAVARV